MAGSHKCTIPPPCNSMEAYLLLEAAQSDHQICLMCKDLACEVIHCNTIALQLNHIPLERSEKALQVADEFIGHVHVTIRQSGQSAALEYAMHETQSTDQSFGKLSFFFLQLCHNKVVRRSGVLVRSQCRVRLGYLMYC